LLSSSYANTLIFNTSVVRIGYDAAITILVVFTLLIASELAKTKCRFGNQCNARRTRSQQTSISPVPCALKKSILFAAVMLNCVQVLRKQQRGRLDETTETHHQCMSRSIYSSCCLQCLCEFTDADCTAINAASLRPRTHKSQYRHLGGVVLGCGRSASYTGPS
jgi:hypothetical protein